MNKKEFFGEFRLKVRAVNDAFSEKLQKNLVSYFYFIFIRFFI